jgi:transcriptional regulator with XRE-family HTH domain
MHDMEFSNVRVSDVKIAMGALIKSMRVRRKLTQVELAQRLNRSRITIQNAERGNNVTLDTYLLILQFFGEIESFNDYIQSKIDDCHEIESIY